MRGRRAACLLFFVAAACKPAWHKPATEHNFEDQIDDCAARAAEGWPDPRDRKFCEQQVQNFAMPMLRHQIVARLHDRDLPCERALRAIGCGFAVSDKAWIMSLCCGDHPVMWCNHPWWGPVRQKSNN